MIKIIIISIISLILLLYIRNVVLENFQQTEEKTYDESVKETQNRKYYNILITKKKEDGSEETISRDDYFKKYYDNKLQEIQGKNEYLEHIDIGRINNNRLSNNQSGVLNEINELELIDYKYFDKNLINEINKGNDSSLTQNEYTKHKLLELGDSKNKNESLLTKDDGSNSFNSINIGNLNFKSVNDYHKYQMLKKKENTFNLRGYNGDDIFKRAGVLNNKIEINDLFGVHHPVQQRTYSNLVSRGKGGTNEVYDANEKNKLTPIIKKNCPVPYNKGYTIQDLKNIDVSKVDTANRARFTKVYYKDVGGTMKVDGKNQCKECDFPLGCLNFPNRLNMYEYISDKPTGHKGCVNGGNRMCVPCGTCPKGEYYAESLCGEGKRSERDVKCSKCTPCKEGTYKVYGCDNDNSYLDNVCIDMTVCKGKAVKSDSYQENKYKICNPDSVTDPKSDIGYYKDISEQEAKKECSSNPKCKGITYDINKGYLLKNKILGTSTPNINPQNYKCFKKVNNDPGEGNRTYMYKEGIRGSNYGSNDPEKFYKTNIEVPLPKPQKGDLEEQSDGSYKDKRPKKYIDVYRLKDDEGNNLGNPYYGKDRQCKKCEVCPEGFIHLRGCMGKNSTSDTVCQRQIDIVSYINKNISNLKIKDKHFFSRDKLKEKLEKVNKNLIIHDDYLRSKFFIKNNKNEYVDITDLAKSLNLTLSDVNNPKIYKIFNVSYNIEDYIEPKFNPNLY